MKFYVNLISIVVINFILQTKIVSGDYSNCPSINTTNPKFSTSVDTDVEMIEGKSQELTCCIFGVTRILWYFKSRYSNETWKLKSEIIENQFYWFRNLNKTLLFLQPKFYDTGNYKCVGDDNKNNNISAEIVLFVGKGEKDFKLIGHSTPEKVYFNVNTEHTIYCLVKAHKKLFCIFSWIHVEKNENGSIIMGSNLTTVRTNSSLISGYSGYATLTWKPIEDNNRIYNFSLNMQDMKGSQEGYYSCLIYESSKKSDITYLFNFFLIRVNPIYLIIGLTISLLILYLIIYVFKYDIKIIYLQIFRKFLKEKNISSQHKFYFLYNFESNNEFKMIYQIVNEIEARGFSTYFYHRDQTYGKDTIDDVTYNLRNTDVVVIWASPDLWGNGTCKFCLQLLLNNLQYIKRIYIMTSNKKTVFRNCTSKQILVDTQSCISSKLFDCKLEIIGKQKDKSNYPEVWYWHYFLSWLISSLPLKSTPNINHN